MRSAVLTFSIAVLCLLCVFAEIQPQKDFDLQRFAGKWYRVGLAYDSPGFVSYRDTLRISVGVLTPLDNGDVNVTMWRQRSSGCHNKFYIYEKTSVPGQFTYLSRRHKRVKDITVVETDYSDYALVLKHKDINKEFTQVALYGRSQTPRPEMVERFREFALSQGLPEESILTPPPEENCPPGEL